MTQTDVAKAQIDTADHEVVFRTTREDTIFSWWNYEVMKENEKEARFLSEVRPRQRLA